MSLYDLMKRTDIILKKYEKYDAPIKTKSGKATDPFTEEFEEIDAEVDKVIEVREND